MQTNNHDNGVRTLFWIGLALGIVVCIFVGTALWINSFSNTFPNTYQIGMVAMRAASVFNPGAQLCQSYGRTKLGIALLVPGGIGAVIAIVTLGLGLLELLR